MVFSPDIIEYLAIFIISQELFKKAWKTFGSKQIVVYYTFDLKPNFFIMGSQSANIISLVLHYW